MQHRVARPSAGQKPREAGSTRDQRAGCDIEVVHDNFVQTQVAHEDMCVIGRCENLVRVRCLLPFAVLAVFLIFASMGNSRDDISYRAVFIQRKNRDVAASISRCKKPLASCVRAEMTRYAAHRGGIE